MVEEALKSARLIISTRWICFVIAEEASSIEAGALPNTSAGRLVPDSSLNCASMAAQNEQATVRTPAESLSNPAMVSRPAGKSVSFESALESGLLGDQDGEEEYSKRAVLGNCSPCCIE